MAIDTVALENILALYPKDAYDSEDFSIEEFIPGDNALFDFLATLAPSDFLAAAEYVEQRARIEEHLRWTIFTFSLVADERGWRWWREPSGMDSELGWPNVDDDIEDGDMTVGH